MVFLAGNHHTYGHIRCIYTVLANPTYMHSRTTFLAHCQECQITKGYCQECQECQNTVKILSRVSEYRECQNTLQNTECRNTD